MVGRPAGVWGAVRAASRVIAEEQPDVVVGFGGYVALPAYLAARRARVPFVVHEANARPGVANRIGARLTKYVAVSAPSTVNRYRTLCWSVSPCGGRSRRSTARRFVRRLASRLAWNKPTNTAGVWWIPGRPHDQRGGLWCRQALTRSGCAGTCTPLALATLSKSSSAPEIRRTWWCPMSNAWTWRTPRPIWSCRDRAP